MFLRHRTFSERRASTAHHTNSFPIWPLTFCTNFVCMSLWRCLTLQKRVRVSLAPNVVLSFGQGNRLDVWWPYTVCITHKWEWTTKWHQKKEERISKLPIVQMWIKLSVTFDMWACEQRERTYSGKDVPLVVTLQVKRESVRTLLLPRIGHYVLWASRRPWAAASRASIRLASIIKRSKSNLPSYIEF